MISAQIKWIKMMIFDVETYAEAMVKEEMAKEGILIKDCSTFFGLGDSFFRVTVRSYGENLELVETVRDIVNKKSS